MDLSDDINFLSGLEHIQRGDFDEAIGSFERALASLPDSSLVYYELGLAYQLRAEAGMPMSMRIQEPNSSQAQGQGIARSLYGAFNALAGLAVIGTSKVVGQTDWILRFREDLRNSAAALERAITVDPNNDAAYFALAHTLRYLGQNEQASVNALKAAQLAPENRIYEKRSETIDSELARAGTGKTERVETWDDVVLPARTKKELRQMQLLLEKPGLSRELGIEPPTGLLLYGPPGTGKTTIARILANESKCRFFATTPAEVNSMWLGESEKQVARLFAQARANAPSIVFLDEIDALLPSRSGGINQYSDKVVNQFLHEMDGLTGNYRVFVVGATNRRDMLDPALLRGGRLSREIQIPLPDEDARIALFALCTRNAKLSEEVSLESLASRTAGFSGANIKAVVNEAGLQALIRIADSSDVQTAAKQLTSADFDEALLNYKAADDDPPTAPWRWG